ncbi:MAG: histidinol-phosphatase [Ignavibacteria bacterium]|jgi:myo-inositol-1(or 4)-monophosphatase|nr:histidinol-phosphatase [Ignavibacteria bacterium]MCU7504784.1 histidinol-phosphatase [Ignavibacteria bacterium]MCU7518347.1 histidinol-phosphatase [Ignavibacteria bacterium]
MDELKKFAKLLADKSGEIVRGYFRTKIQIESKQDLSPVTIADKKAEEAMREMIMKEFPDHGILGEEFGSHNIDSDYQWVLDPIDGTKSFICGAVSFGTLIALMKNNQPILGVINQPVLNDFLIGDNFTAELNGQKVRLRQCNGLSDAVLLTTDHLHIEKYQNLPAFENLIHKVKLYRNWGDCYGYYLVATGFADVMIDPEMSVWDSMALIPVIRGAGGIITDYQGNDPVQGHSIVAAGPSIHGEVIRLLNP